MGGIAANTLEESFKELSEVSITAHINTYPDNDGIIRKSLNSIIYNGRVIKSFDWTIYDEYIKNTEQNLITTKIPQDAWNRSYIDFIGTSKYYSVISYVDVLEGKVKPEYFKNKIVLIGIYSLGLGDIFQTPLEKTSESNMFGMFGVEVHANIIQNFLEGRFKKEVSYIFNLLLLITISFGTFFAYKKLGNIKSLLLMTAIVILYVTVSKYVYYKGYIMQLSYPILLLVIIYLLVLAYRYMEELLERKRVTNVFGRYVAPQVVGQILKGGEESLKLGGTRKEITALFVDIRGFTPLSEKVQPEEVVDIVNDYLNLCAKSIFKYGGTVDKFIGDAAMAIYNAPLDIECHAFKAVQTALAMKEGSLVLQKALEAKYGRGVQFGIGINSGAAVVGNIGCSFRMDYTAIGDTVNIAARLESNAKPGQILISQSTYDLVKDRVKAISLGKIKVKGKEEGISIYQVEGVV